ncbi:Yip1 family protein [Undibacterium sp. Tian12W]|uniref:Yip1 family protein n=1 Tax=Undibacterium sp. Tian12W TaxID=3413054 RepID=UPI003BF39808
MNLVERAKNITLTPKTEWPVIAAETTSTADLFKNYVAPLAAIPAVATFIGMSIVGVTLPIIGTTVRMSPLSGISAMIMQFLQALIGIYLFSLIINALAPQFGAEKNPEQALKLSAYAFTPSLLVGALMMLPFLGSLLWLVFLAVAAYSVYILFLGMPVLMKVPQEKVVPYTAVSMICSFVAIVIIHSVVNMVIGNPYASSISSISTSSKSAEVSGALGELEKMGQKMEEANKKMEAAKKSGDPQAEMKAATEAIGVALGAGSQAEVVDKDKLKALFPETIGNLKRNSLEGEKSAMGEFKVSKAEARYGDENNHQIRMTITDTGGSKMFGTMFAWGMIEQDKETDTGYEKMGKVNGRPTHERFQKDGPSGEYSLLIAGRFMVEAHGDNVDMATIKTASAAVGYDKLEAMKNEGVKQ